MRLWCPRLGNHTFCHLRIINQSNRNRLVVARLVAQPKESFSKSPKFPRVVSKRVSPQSPRIPIISQNLTPTFNFHSRLLSTTKPHPAEAGCSTDDGDAEPSDHQGSKARIRKDRGVGAQLINNATWRRQTRQHLEVFQVPSTYGDFSTQKLFTPQEGSSNSISGGFFSSYLIIITFVFDFCIGIFQCSSSLQHCPTQLHARSSTQPQQQHLNWQWSSVDNDDNNVQRQYHVTRTTTAVWNLAISWGHSQIQPSSTTTTTTWRLLGRPRQGTGTSPMDSSSFWSSNIWGGFTRLRRMDIKQLIIQSELNVQQKTVFNEQFAFKWTTNLILWIKCSSKNVTTTSSSSTT